MSYFRNRAVAREQLGVTLGNLGVSAFAQTLLDDATASAALTTLGLSAYAQTLADDATAGDARTTLGLSSGHVYAPMEFYRNAATSITGGASAAAFANPGAAFTASTHQWYAATFGLGTLVYARWVVAWTPGHASNSCAIRLVHSDSGPTNTTEITRFTQTGTTPRVDAVDVTTDLQALVANKTLHHQTLGNGAESPGIYLSMLELVFKVTYTA